MNGAVEAKTHQPKVPSHAVVLGLEQGLFQAAAERFESVRRTRGTTREVIAWAVGQHLEDLKFGLLRLGFRGGEIGKRRPRRINDADWDRLQEVSRATGVPASQLLRACLEWIKEGQR